MKADELKTVTTDALNKLAALLDAGHSDRLTALLKTMGRFVRKGEKGIAILAPIVGRRNAGADEDDSKSVVGFRAAYVFDVAQTDGEPLPEAAETSGDPGTKTAALRSAILDRGIAIEVADDLGGALGTATTGRIQILNGLSPAETFVVLAHEYALLAAPC